MWRGQMFSIFSVFYLCCSSAIQFHDLSLDEIATRAQSLVSPFASVNSADELWGSDLKSPKCSALVLRVTDFETLDQYLTTRPQLVLSGELHGDERVGPTSTLFTAELLVWASQCKIQKDSAPCAKLELLQVTDDQITWLAFLAAKRDTYILPTPNCMGYLHNQRLDQGVDPNRDFPYSRKDRKCLITKTALIFDALFRNVTVQTLVTFHGGMVAIGYEWGSVQHPRGRDKCPDHLAHSQIADAFITFAGGFKGQQPYRAAPINSIVYSVEGGMEDWAYAAGWDVELNVPCAGRPMLATAPPNRAVTFLVETSDRKGPPASEMGHDSAILSATEATRKQFSGHVPRNSRLSLTAIDSVQPYLCFSTVTLTPLSPSSSPSLSVAWYVGGGFKVKATWLSWHVAPAELLSRLSSTQSHSQSAAERSGILEQFVYSLSPPSPPVLSHDKWITATATAKGNGQHSHRGERGSFSYSSGWLSGSARWDWKDPFDLKEGLFEISSVPLPLALLLNASHSRDRDRHKGEDKERLEGKQGMGRRRRQSRLWRQERNASLAQPLPLAHYPAPALPSSSHRSLLSELKPSTSTPTSITTTLLLVAWGEVDSDWGNSGQGYPSTEPQKTRSASASHLRGAAGQSSGNGNGAQPFPPQSHLSNARSNEKWREVNSAGVVKVQGRRFFPSDPVLVTFTVPTERQGKGLGKRSGQQRGTEVTVMARVESLVTHCASWDRKES